MEELLVTIAGFVGGFVSTLASNGSSVTLPALELLGLPEHVANGTNRLSVVALGLVGTISFARERLIDWRKGGWIAVLIAAGTIVGSLAATRLSDEILDAIVVAGLLLVLGMRPAARASLGSHRPYDPTSYHESGAGARRACLHPRHLPRRRRSRHRRGVDHPRARARPVGRKPPLLLHRPQGTRRLGGDGEVFPPASAARAGGAPDRLTGGVARQDRRHTGPALRSSELEE